MRGNYIMKNKKFMKPFISFIIIIFLTITVSNTNNFNTSINLNSELQLCEDYSENSPFEDTKEE